MCYVISSFGPEWPRIDRLTWQIVTDTSILKTTRKHPSIENIQATHLLELVHLDYHKIEVTEGGKNVYVLVFMDHFMLYTQALVTSSQAVNCTAQALWDIFIVHYGLPESIISDQGQNFESGLIVELCKLAKIWKLHTFPYYPICKEMGSANTSVMH